MKFSLVRTADATPSMKNQAYSIRIFLPDSTPEGTRVVEKSNWTGCGIVCPRSLFPVAKTRIEFTRAGVYLLLGPSENSELPRLYIGEGDPIRPRLEQHAAKKDFWTTLIAFTSKDSNLNKAHVQYLEARLVQLASEAKRTHNDNSNQPQLPSLSEADTAEVEGFLSEMLLCFPVLGITAFSKPVMSRKPSLSLKAKGIIAWGDEAPDGFVVRAGSTAVFAEVPSIHPYLSALRRDLLAQHILSLEGNTYRFQQDYTFNSPSTAAGVTLGRSANGRMEWKTADGHSLKEIQDQTLDSTDQELTTDGARLPSVEMRAPLFESIPREQLANPASWTGNDASQRNHHSAIPLAKGDRFDLVLNWKSSEKAPAQSVGSFRFYLSRLLRSGYISRQRNGSYRFRLIHDEDGSICLQRNIFNAPKLRIGAILGA